MIVNSARMRGALTAVAWLRGRKKKNLRVGSMQEALARGCRVTELIYCARQQMRIRFDLLSEPLAGFISVFNSDAIILGGFLDSMYGSMPERVHAKVAEHSIPAVAQRVRVERARLGSQLLMVGAAELAFGSRFEDPLGTASQAERTP